MHILGVSCFYHDAAAALLRDGVLVAAAEEERFSRRKHDSGFPRHAIEFCLRSAGIAAADLDYVVFYEKPLLKFERLLRSILDGVPRSARLFREAMIAWFGEKLWIKTQLLEHLGLPESRLLFAEHHVSHAASAFLCSPFPEAAILTVDGVGEWATVTLGVGTGRPDGGSAVRLLAEQRFPHSLGLLYSAFTAFLGFDVNEGEYKVMGMAPYGAPKYADEVWRLVRPAADGSFGLDLDYFSFPYHTEQTISRKFEDLFGPPRDPRARFVTAATSLYDDPEPPTVEELERNQRYADVAASIQQVTEELLLGMARHLHAQTGQRRLCLAGGVALNSVASARLLAETPFEELYVQPAAGDSGGALGAALYAWHVLLGRPRAFVLDRAAWGAQHPESLAVECCRAQGIPHRLAPDEDRLLDEVAEALAAGQVVGWHQGRFEWGPRALGQRSILADPRRAEMKDRVNIKTKFREPFRPFAPSVLAERAGEFFDLGKAAGQMPLRFMLLVVPVREGARQRIPATTHVDGTARIQAVTPDAVPLYHRLIARFGEATGVPVILNTSFNLKGEPIVNTPEEAIQTFSRSGMDILVVGRCVMHKDGMRRPARPSPQGAGG